MGLLENYKEQNPEAFRAAPIGEPSREYGFFIRLVMRASGGKIRDVSKAAQVLAIAGAVILGISMIIFIYNFFGSGASRNPFDNTDQRQFSGGK